MDTFIQKLVNKIESINNHDYQNILIVLPNRRARRKLLNELSLRHSGVTFFAPATYPMDEFVSYLSPLTSIDATTQILRLHQATKNIPIVQCEPSELLSWCNPFLHDISDMDMQLQDVENILKEHAIAAKFEVSFGKDAPSEYDKSKIQFNEYLADIYSNYKNLLYSRAEAYPGMIYRDCAENIAEYAKKIDAKQIIFAGFYALSLSELTIIKYFKDNFSTEIIFDIDPFYCDLKTKAKNQTSFFINRDCEFLNIDKNNISFVENLFENANKQITIIETSQKIRQIYSALDAVKKIQKEKESYSNDNDLSDTAVVLADESMVTQLLSVFNDDNLNITMGIPFSSTTLFALIKSFIQTYENAMLTSEITAEKLRFAGSDLQLLLDDYNMKCRSEKKTFSFPANVDVFNNTNIKELGLFLTDKKFEIGRRLPEIVAHFCDVVENKKLDDNDLTLIHYASKLMKELQEEFDNTFSEDRIIDFALAKQLVFNRIESIQMSKIGNSDTGLQVMGLLETRMLDFKNVVLIATNEGVLPKGIRYDSLLPFFFKYQYSGGEALENYLYQDQVYAYHFFRLLQRAENITLIYDSTAKDTVVEASRFIAQLRFEAKQKNLTNIKFNDYFADFELYISENQHIVVEKNDEIINRLKETRYSASALSSYISCPMKFFFEKIANIKREPVLTQELASNEVGTIMHEIFKTVFEKIKDNIADYKSIIDESINNISEITINAIKNLPKNNRIINDEDLEKGAWLVSRHLIEENVKNYLNKAKDELNISSLSILGNEQKFNADITIQDPNSEIPQELTLKLYGIFDRIQQKGGYIEILDYKTGYVDPSKLKSSYNEDETREISPIFTDIDYNKLFQLVFYTILYRKTKNSKNLPIKVGVISTQAVNKSNENEYIFYGKINDDEVLSNYLELFESDLSALLSEILNKEQPFVCTPGDKNCRYCDFSTLCKTEN